MTIPDHDTFNAAVRQAVSHRLQWRTPIRVWMWLDADNQPPAMGFYASAAPVPPARSDDEVICSLSADTLAMLAAMLDDPETFDGFVTGILRDAQDAIR